MLHAQLLGVCAAATNASACTQIADIPQRLLSADEVTALGMEDID
jgi:hypothetical protein